MSFLINSFYLRLDTENSFSVKDLSKELTKLEKSSDKDSLVNLQGG